jgi:CENP-B N-terminal DNA-binding domain
MSRKIPQSEWGAIIARREQGESLNAIARSYNCSAATIHSIVNRAREGGAPDEAAPEETAAESAPADEPTAPPAPPAAAELPDFLTRPPLRPAAAAAPRPVLNGHGALRPSGEPRPLDRRQPRRNDPGPPRQEAAGPRPDARAGQPTAGARPVAPPAHALSARPEALTATLDAGLRAHAEAILDAFRKAFDRALAENTDEAREALRLAAGELMRAGARTTIVIERLEAASHRPSFPRRERANGTAPQRPAG